ncbi:putative orfan [Tupanvirus soda lake]|uniref:Orfan n=2 Tax=Tupanvirus TaxID=2094720 RepID=A0AC62AD55_9VIRU|nr:putative orfan [Tupanvirus soda lake]QKU35722.1 putative orfan [Tupanvirus soda lake]
MEKNNKTNNKPQTAREFVLLAIENGLNKKNMKHDAPNPKLHAFFDRKINEYAEKSIKESKELADELHKNTASPEKEKTDQPNIFCDQSTSPNQQPMNTMRCVYVDVTSNSDNSADLSIRKNKKVCPVHHLEIIKAFNIKIGRPELDKSPVLLETFFEVQNEVLKSLGLALSIDVKLAFQFESYKQHVCLYGMLGFCVPENCHDCQKLCKKGCEHKELWSVYTYQHQPIDRSENIIFM